MNSRKVFVIFSDLVQETKSLNLRKSLKFSAHEHMARLNSDGLIAGLKGVNLHILGAEVRDLKAQEWHRLHEFWELYFTATHANLIHYSVLRNLPELRH